VKKKMIDPVDQVILRGTVPERRVRPIDPKSSLPILKDVLSKGYLR
jgi:hypothetical protein